MNNLLKGLNGTRSSALGLASDAANGLRNSVGLVLKTVGGGVSLLGLRDASRTVTKAARRNPATTAAAVSVAVGAGVALWLLRRNKQRRGLDETMQRSTAEPIEVHPIRVERKPARRTARKTARKTAERPAAST